MKVIKCFFFFIFTITLSADLEDHFKKAADHSGPHTIRNIDFIYMINLDQRPEKFALALKQLTPYGITPYRFSAVNGWELSLEAINDVGIKYEFWMKTGRMGTQYLLKDKGEPHHEMVEIPGETYFSHCMTRGAIGIVLSHLSILQDAYDAGYETIWVMEDDIEVIQDPRRLSDLIEKLDQVAPGWDVFFTDRETKNNLGQQIPCTEYNWRPNFHYPDPQKPALRRDVSADFRQIGARFGAYSMIIRRSGMQKILQFFKNYHVFLPYDIDYYTPLDLTLYTVSSDIVSTQIKAPSDNGAPNYLQRSE